MAVIAKARDVQLNACSSSFAAAHWVVFESLELPLLKAPLLRWGSSCAGKHGGRPGVPPLQKRKRRSAPSSVWPSASHLPPQGKAYGRVRTPAPTACSEVSCPFVGAGHWTARHIEDGKAARPGGRALQGRTPVVAGGHMGPPLRQKSDREHWFRKARRKIGTAPIEIFANPGPSGPD